MKVTLLCVLKVVCSYCQEIIRDGVEIDGQPSHGICEDCYDIMSENYNYTIEDVKRIKAQRIRNEQKSIN